MGNRKWDAGVVDQWNESGTSRHSQEGWLLGGLAEPAGGMGWMEVDPAMVRSWS